MPLPNGNLTIEKLDKASWRALEDSLDGAGVATTCTLLAALWPDEHVVFDWRVHAAANALRLHADLPLTATITVDSSTAPPITLDDYGSVRAWMVDTARVLQVDPAEVERTLYVLSKRVGSPDRGQRRTWKEYASVLSAQLATYQAGASLAPPEPTEQSFDDDDEEVVEL